MNHRLKVTKNFVFESWMCHFIKYTENLKKPIPLFHDGHGSHMTGGTVKKAIDTIIVTVISY